MRFLRTNTAIRLTVGPFLDKTDGVTPETAITVTSCKLTFMVDDGNVPTLILDTAPTASGGANDMVHVTGDDAGFYDLELAAANVNYLGRAMLAITDAATHCPVFHEFMILPAMIYDSLILGTDDLDTNAKKWNDLATVALPLVPTTAGRTLDVAATGEAGLDFNNVLSSALVTLHSLTVTNALTASNASNSVNLGTDSIGSTQLAASAVTEMQSGLSTLTQTQVTGGAYALNSASFAFNSGMDFTTTQKAATLARVTLTDTLTTYTGNTPQTGDSYLRIGSTGSGLTSLAPASTALSTAQWSITRAGYLDYLPLLYAGSLSELSTVNDASATTTSFITVLNSSVDDFYNDALLVFTSGALSGQARPILDYVGGSTKRITVSEAFTSAPANGVTFTIRSEHIHPVTQIAAGVRTEMDSNSTQLAAIVADTNELQTDWANGGRLDLILDARASQTSITTAQADLDILTGADGVTLATSQPNYAPATATALASLVTTVGVAGVGLTEAGGTGDQLTALPWNAAWDAEVQSEVNDALLAALTEGYRTAGSTGSVAQLLYEIAAHLGRSAIVSTTKTLKKIDGSTTAKTYTLDSATVPTAITETT